VEGKSVMAKKLKVSTKLYRWADFLEKLPPEKLRMQTWISEVNDKATCGTVCCAAGWLPKVFPRSARNLWWRIDGIYPGITFLPERAIGFLGITEDEFEHIAYPLEYWKEDTDENFDKRIPKSRVVARIRKLAREYEKKGE
jgi:hypothetical protein